MTVREKPTLDRYLLVLAALLLGLLIQMGLGWQRQEREYAAGSELLRAVRTAFCEEGERRLEALRAEERRLAELQQYLEDGAERHRGVLAEKRARFESLPWELLILVNPWHSVPEGYEPELSELWLGTMVDSRCAEPLMRMLEDCAAAGNAPYICSSYRTQWMQVELYYNKVARVQEEGWGWEDALRIAAQSVAYPGTSEHQLGLAVDIIDEFYPFLNEEQENTGTQKWLIENAWRYGFILRYPNGTTDITGIIYEPWHYRYVGSFAGPITRSGLTLEQYLDTLAPKRLER